MRRSYVTEGATAQHATIQRYKSDFNVTAETGRRLIIITHFIRSKRTVSEAAMKGGLVGAYNGIGYVHLMDMTERTDECFMFVLTNEINNIKYQRGCCGALFVEMKCVELSG